SERAGLFRPEPLANAAVLRYLPRADNALSTAERIELDAQPVHPRQMQARRGARVLPPAGGGAEMDQPGAGTPDQWRPVRADRSVAGKTLSTAERIASRGGRSLQGHLSS